MVTVGIFPTSDNINTRISEENNVWTVLF